MSEAKVNKKDKTDKKKDKSDKKEKKEKHSHANNNNNNNNNNADTADNTASAVKSSLAVTADAYIEDFSANQTKIEELCKVFPNNMCQDCNASGTRWAVPNHGVFVCIRCSGLHRSLGVHISKVKSTNMDKWTAAEVAMMEEIGNKRGKELFEASVPRGHKQHTGQESDSTMTAFIQKKYDEKAFATAGISEILKKIGKKTGYGRKGGVPRHLLANHHHSHHSHHHSDAAAATVGETSSRPSSPTVKHSDPLADLFGSSSPIGKGAVISAKVGGKIGAEGGSDPANGGEGGGGGGGGDGGNVVGPLEQLLQRRAASGAGGAAAHSKRHHHRHHQATAKPVDGVFGPCTVSIDEHDERRALALALFGLLEHAEREELAVVATSGGGDDARVAGELGVEATTTTAAVAVAAC